MKGLILAILLVTAAIALVSCPVGADEGTAPALQLGTGLSLSSGLGEAPVAGLGTIRFVAPSVEVWAGYEGSRKLIVGGDGKSAGYIVDLGVDVGDRIFGGVRVTYRDGGEWSKTRYWGRLGARVGALKAFVSVPWKSKEHETEIGLRVGIGQGRVRVEPGILLVTYDQRGRHYGAVVQLGLVVATADVRSR